MSDYWYSEDDEAFALDEAYYEPDIDAIIKGRREDEL